MSQEFWTVSLDTTKFLSMNVCFDPVLGAGTSRWLSARFLIKRSRIRVPGGETGEMCLLQGKPFVLTLISVSVPRPCYRSGM